MSNPSEDPLAHRPGIGPKGAGSWLQHAYWIGTEPKREHVTNFAKALGRAQASGESTLTKEQLVHLIPLFADDVIFKLQTAEGVVRHKPSVLFTSNAVRLVVTNASTDVLRKVIEAADAIIPNRTTQTSANMPTLIRILETLGPFPIKHTVGELLETALNCPVKCGAYVYSTTEDKVVVWRETLKISPERVAAACRCAYIVDLPETRALSRNVCVWCAASPMGEEINLRLCPGCRCVVLLRGT